MRTLMTFGDVTLAQCEDGDFAVTREGEGMWLYCPGDLWSALMAYARRSGLPWQTVVYTTMGG